MTGLISTGGRVAELTLRHDFINHDLTSNIDIGIRNSQQAKEGGDHDIT